MWDQEDHSHWRSLIHQPQTAELSRSSGGRGSDELRRRDQQDVRIRAGSAQVVLPPTKQDQGIGLAKPSAELWEKGRGSVQGRGGMGVDVWSKAMSIALE
ncbi:unnamed protein product [Arctogadus glacialis]